MTSPGRETELSRVSEGGGGSSGVAHTERIYDIEKLNTFYRGNKKNDEPMTDEDIDKKMKQIVNVWSLTQLFGVFGMPLWLAVIATQWYTARNLLPGQVALVITLSKCIDVITDPMMAYYLRTCTMYKIATIAVVGSAIQALSFAAMFYYFKPNDPSGGSSRVLLQYAVCYVFFFVGDTMTGTPTTTLGTMLKSQRILSTKHHNNGMRLGSMAKVGGILLMGFTTFAAGKFMTSQGYEFGSSEGVFKGLTPKTNFYCAIFFGLIHFAINCRFWSLIKSFEDSVCEISETERLEPFLKGFSAMMTSSYNNPFFRQLIGAWVCDQLTITLVKNLLMWFVRHNVEPNLAPGCLAYSDPANAKYVTEGGFETGQDKYSFECSADSIVKGGVFFVIVGAMVGNVFWQKKIDSETDEYGNGNLYKNWLLFNLSSALTNGLMVFVGRGDSRLFWLLCFINGLPFGGEFMTDTILLHLIASETWLHRSERAMDEPHLAKQLDSHTTKFSMMKTFIPKVVSLVAEAIPLSLIAIWYIDPNEACYDSNNVFIGISECESQLLYSDGSPKYVFQRTQVRELIAFFFFVLPTATTLASYYLKSGFQVTDTSYKLFIESCREGCPGYQISWFSYGAHKDKEPEQEVDVVKLRSILANYSKKEDSELTKSSVDHLIQQIDDTSQKEVDTDADFISIQSTLTIHKRKLLTDSWIGKLIATTNGQHLFSLPYYGNHFFSKLPISVLKFTLENTPPSDMNTILHSHNVNDSPSMSRLKGVFHGFCGILYVPMKLLLKILFQFGRCALSRVRNSKPKRIAAIHPYEVEPNFTMLFGVMGHRNVSDFVFTIIPLMAARMIQSVGGGWESVPRKQIISFLRMIQHSVGHVNIKLSTDNTCQEALQRYNNNYETLLLLQKSRRDSIVNPRHEGLDGDDTFYKNSKIRLSHTSLQQFKIYKNIYSRIEYLWCAGASFSIAMLFIILIMIILWGGLKPLTESKWSVVITFPLFMSAVGLVVFLYFRGLQHVAWPVDREMSISELFSLAIIHFNSLNCASTQPLVFHPTRSSKKPKNELLSNIAASYETNNEHDDNTISYLIFIPKSSYLSSLIQLESGHRLLDCVALELQQVSENSSSTPSWNVVNISPQDIDYPYVCLLYTWACVDSSRDN